MFDSHQLDSAEHLPLFALPDDSVVEIQGEPAGVHKAVEMVASHLRKFLVDRSVIGLFEMQVSLLSGFCMNFTLVITFF